MDIEERSDVPVENRGSEIRSTKKSNFNTFGPILELILLIIVLFTVVN